MTSRERATGPRRTGLVLALLGGVALLPSCGHTGTAGTLAEAHAGSARFRLTVLEDLSHARDVFRSAHSVYSSTDRGLYVFPNGGPPQPTRLGIAAGLPSEDVLAARLLPDDTLVVLTALGLGAVSTRAGVAAPELPPPPVGTLYDIEVYDGLLHACGEHGLARLERLAADGWRMLSELPGGGLVCRELVHGRDDTLFILGDDTLAQLDGDVLAEHRAPAFPLGRPRALAEGEDGELFVLLEGESGGTLARFHDGAWWSYRWSELGPSATVVGLVAQASVPLLVTTESVFSLRGTPGGSRLDATDVHSGGALLFRVSPSLPQATATLSSTAQRQPARLLLPAVGAASGTPDDAPALFAQALPQVGDAYESAFVSGEFVYLAQPGRGLLEVGETRRPLSTADFRDLRPLHVAIDARGGTWLCADDGTLVRVDDGLGRVYPHGRASALLESTDAAGRPRASDVWVALASGAGEVLLATPAPGGWVEQARVPDEHPLVDVRMGARDEAGHVWLLAHGSHPTWARGYGLVHRDPGGAWSFLEVPLDSRGAQDAVSHLITHGDTAFVAGPAGLARVSRRAAAEVLFAGPVSDVERTGELLTFLSDGNLFQLRLDAATGTRPRPVPFEEEASEALRRVNPAGLALTPTHVLIAGEGGLVLGTFDEHAASELLNAEWDALHAALPGLLAHDVDAGAGSAWVARRDGAVFLLTPR